MMYLVYAFRELRRRYRLLMVSSTAVNLSTILYVSISPISDHPPQRSHPTHLLEALDSTPLYPPLLNPVYLLHSSLSSLSRVQADPRHQIPYNSDPVPDIDSFSPKIKLDLPSFLLYYRIPHPSRSSSKGKCSHTSNTAVSARTSSANMSETDPKQKP